MTFAEAIKQLPGVEGCRVLVEEQPKGEDEELVNLGFRDSHAGGLRFRFEFFGKGGRSYYTSEVYYKPDGITLTEFALKTLDKVFPKGTWPRQKNAKPIRI